MDAVVQNASLSESARRYVTYQSESKALSERRERALFDDECCVMWMR